MPKISIIVPVYNVEPYLNRCVDSILAQTFEGFELILVDDGSTDRCGTICDEYAVQDSRIKVIHKENGGLSSARNAGLDVAIGDYIGFVDGDDFIHPQMYEIMYKTAVDLCADAVQCSFHRFFEHELPIPQEIVCHEEDISLICTNDLLSSFFPHNCYKFSSTVCNKLYSRNSFASIRFPLGVYYEDSYVQLSLIDTTSAVATIPLELYYYLQRSGSIMHSNYSPHWFQGTNNNNNNNLRFFRQKGYSDQVEFALDDLLTRFSKDKLAVYHMYPEYKKEFHDIERTFLREFFAIMKNSKICKMKKLLALSLLVAPKTAFGIALKYFPECIHTFMRPKKGN